MTAFQLQGTAEAIGQMEIITGVERRRRWRLEEKSRMVAETEQPAARFVEIARRYEVCRSLLWNWRRQVRRGPLRVDSAPVFPPVGVFALAIPSPLLGAARAARRHVPPDGPGVAFLRRSGRPDCKGDALERATSNI
jgi:hypothetical protein